MTLPVVIPSLLNSGVDPKNIYIFEGGYYERSVGEYLGANHIKVDHNSFDYTALIDIVENEIESEYWFLLHDTCVVGAEFNSLLQNIPENKPNVICMLGHHPGTMNICSYKYSYLLEKKEQIIKLKNHDYSAEGTMQAKIVAIEAENSLQGGSVIYNPDRFTDIWTEKVENPYKEDGIERNLRYFNNLDVYKYQANYGQWPRIIEL